MSKPGHADNEGVPDGRLQRLHPKADGRRRMLDDDTSIEALTERVAMLEALVERLTAQGLAVPAAPTLHQSDAELAPTSASSTPGGPLPRRNLIGKAGMAAVGAVLGGAVAAVGTASPAAAATGTFDTNDSTPALTATTTASSNPPGPAIKAASTGWGKALEVTGGVSVLGEVELESTNLPLKVTGPSDFRSSSSPSVNIQSSADNGFGLSARGVGGGALLRGDRTGAVAVGGTDHGIWAASDGTGARLEGEKSQLLLGQGAIPSNLYYMPPPRGRDDANVKGSIYFDTNSDLWICVADGTPGTWVRLAGPGTAGAFTVLAAPVRVYDTRTGSGYPGAGTGPFTGERTGIDLTANTSGVPTDATAAVVMITALDTSATRNAYIKLYADDVTTAPLASALRWNTAGSLIATTTTTRLTNAKARLKLLGRSNVILDVVGYYR